MSIGGGGGVVGVEVAGGERSKVIQPSSELSGFT